MIDSTTLPDDLTLSIQKDMHVEAPIAVTFDAVLEQLGPRAESQAGQPMPMKLEARPGGRWFRDLGDDTGHLWGNVQVIKPPTLLEITGPLFMSYPAVSHVQFRLTERDGGTQLAFAHRAIGMIDPEHRQGVKTGWDKLLDHIRQIAEHQ